MDRVGALIGPSCHPKSASAGVANPKSRQCIEHSASHPSGPGTESMRQKNGSRRIYLVILLSSKPSQTGSLSTSEGINRISVSAIAEFDLAVAETVLAVAETVSAVAETVSAVAETVWAVAETVSAVAKTVSAVAKTVWAVAEWTCRSLFPISRSLFAISRKPFRILEFSIPGDAPRVRPCTFHFPDSLGFGWSD